MTWAKRLFIGATSVLVVLAAVPGFLLGTETGLQIIKGALEKAVPGLRIESLSGSVFSLKADNLQYDVPGLAFHGNLSWDLSVAKLLSRRVALHDFEISDASLLVRTQEMASSASTPVPKSPTQKLDETQTSRFKTPVAVIVERVAIKNLQADIDGNVVNVGLFQTQAVWTKDRLDIDSVRLADSSLASAQTPPSDEPLGAMLKRTFAQPVVPEIPTVDLPLDVNLKHFELSRFVIKGNPDQIIESATFALTARNGVATLENIAVRGDSMPVMKSILNLTSHLSCPAKQSQPALCRRLPNRQRKTLKTSTRDSKRYVPNDSRLPRNVVPNIGLRVRPENRSTLKLCREKSVANSDEKQMLGSSAA